MRKREKDLGTPQKVFLIAVPLREGGVKGRSLRKKDLFFTFNFKKKLPTAAIKLEGEGEGTAIKKKYFFCGFPY